MVNPSPHRSVNEFSFVDITTRPSSSSDIKSNLRQLAPNPPFYLPRRRDLDLTFVFLFREHVAWGPAGPSELQGKKRVGMSIPIYIVPGRIIRFMVLSVWTVAINVPCVVQAQTAKKSAVDEVQQAAKQGFSFATSSNVSGNVFIEAVLIPPRIARNVFGKTVANGYAVIALTYRTAVPTLH
jgi:hypothetical protein